MPMNLAASSTVNTSLLESRMSSRTSTRFWSSATCLCSWVSFWTGFCCVIFKYYFSYYNVYVIYYRCLVLESKYNNLKQRKIRKPNSWFNSFTAEQVLYHVLIRTNTCCITFNWIASAMSLHLISTDQISWNFCQSKEKCGDAKFHVLRKAEEKRWKKWLKFWKS